MTKITNKAESIKAKLKNLAKIEQITPHLKYMSYVFGQFLYRVSLSPYRENFILKGGVLLYCIDANIRQTTDLDFLVQNIPKSKSKIKTILCEICSIEAADPLIFDVNNLSIDDSMVFQDYNGFKVNIPYAFSEMREYLQIDIGFNDVIHPYPQKVRFPLIMEKGSIIIEGYTVETLIAEKIHSIYIWGSLNTRMKDYYDLFKLSEIFAFEQIVLLKAIYKTFTNRKTSISKDSLNQILTDTTLNRDFTRFCLTNRFEAVDFQIVRIRLQALFMPIFELLENKTMKYKQKWNFTIFQWE